MVILTLFNITFDNIRNILSIFAFIFQDLPMRISILFIFLIFSVCNANAQFYTIGTVSKPAKTRSDNTNNALIEVSTDCLPEDTIQDVPDINELLVQYNSVSYPLKKIRITSPFGVRFHPIDKVRKLHNGIDLSAKNEEVYAVLDGIVELTGYNSISGNYIILKHAAGLMVSYCHLSKSIKVKGDLVRAGDVVAVSGNTGKSTNFHLHFVVRKDGKYLDPAILIKYVEKVRKDIIHNYIQKIEA